MREERLLIAGGAKLREVTVEEELTAGVRAELVLAFEVDDNAGVVTVVSGGSKVLLREGSALSTGVNSMDVVSSDDSESMSSAILASSSMMASYFSRFRELTVSLSFERFQPDGIFQLFFLDFSPPEKFSLLSF